MPILPPEAALEALEELSAQFIWGCASKVRVISAGSEALATYEKAANEFLTFIHQEVDDVAWSTTTHQAGQANLIEALSFVERQFSDAGERLRIAASMQIHGIPALDEPLPQPANPKGRGGRPVAAHWDEMLAATAVMLLAGDLQPKTQADIERAMKDWLAARNLDGSDTAVRDRARPLWQGIKERGKPLVYDWEEMWATIAAKLYVGDLKPETEADVADIERAMKEWLAARNLDVDHTAIRDRARSLWQKIQEAN